MRLSELLPRFDREDRERIEPVLRLLARQSIGAARGCRAASPSCARSTSRR
jgi:hypothetical protein